MNFVKTILFVSFFYLLPLASFSQSYTDSIILLNGRVYNGHVQSSENGLLTYEYPNKKGEVLLGFLDEYRVFSYTTQGKTSVLYKQNESMNNFLTTTEALNATLGSYDARQTFKPRVTFWSSLVIGCAASIYDTYLPESVLNNPKFTYTEAGFFTKKPSLLPILVPLVLSAGWAIPSFKVKEKQILQTHLKNDESYYRGYHRVAKQKRILAALKGGLIGVGVGMLTYYVVQ
ncbi:hypothetical protein [Crocinitomix catalasitica]|uniref:hypothetical protein n=1 Tax=Crocinitomix catalasitica TaxID=184607 RepID=UPI0004855B94|nr:hypothetical protein [Crocinitomix catalasitica]